MKVPSEMFSTRARVVLTWVVAGMALGWPHDVLRSQQRGQVTQNVLAGSRVFGTKGCAGCHAVNGLGGGLGPDLGSVATPHSLPGFTAAMWNHLPTMMAQMREIGIERRRMSSWEAEDLMAFLFWVDHFEPAGDPEVGEHLFVEKDCAVCHQVGGVGGVYGPNLDFLARYGSSIQIAAAMWNHGPSMSEAMRARGLRRPTFTGAELTDLIAYLESAVAGLPSEPMYVLPGRAEDGRRYFNEKGCRVCHSVQGVGGRVGPPLDRPRGRQTLIDFAAALWNKEPAMLRAVQSRGMAVPQFRADEMADLVAYLYSVDYLGRSGSPTRGRRLLRNKGCLGCHSLEGSGGTTGGDLAEGRDLSSRGAVVAALWNHSLLGDAIRTDAWPTFTDSEMADLSIFLQTLRRTR